MLCDIIDEYGKADTNIYNKAVKSLNEISIMLQNLEKETSPLAYMINDVPTFTMSEEVVHRMQNYSL